MDPYMGTGYKTDGAREEARAFKTPPPTPMEQFVFPVGVPSPVPVTAPSPPPPVTPITGVGAAAAGAGGSVALPLVIIASGLGVAGGLWVKEDIDKWKKGYYRKAQVGRGYPDYDPLFSFNQEVDLSRYYWDSDYGKVWTQFDTGDVYAPGGWFHPYYVYCPAAPPGAGSLPNFYGSFTDQCGTDQSGSLYLYSSHPWTDPRPGNGLVRITHTIRDDAFPTIRKTGQGQFNLVLPGPPVELWKQGTAGSAVTQAMVLAEPKPFYRRGWGTAVAPRGTQPSLEQQLREHVMPHGRTDHGFEVPFVHGFPLVLVYVAPGSPPVTVPDVVIDPGDGTEPGTVSIAPPGHTVYPSNAEPREQKPGNRMRSAGAVFVNVASETNDFLEAMHKGLPKKLRSKGRWGMVPEPDIILRDIWDHWDEFDSQVAFEAFVNNQIEDHILGKYYFGKLPGSRAWHGNRAAGKGLAGIKLPEVHFAHGQASISLGDYEIDLNELGRLGE